MAHWSLPMAIKAKSAWKLIIFICVWSLLLMTILNMFSHTGSSNYSELISTADREPTMEEIQTMFMEDMETFLLAGSEEPSKAELIAALQLELPNVPFDLWQRAERKLPRVNNTCALYATPLQLEFHNTYWQAHRSANVTFQLFGAYYDKRADVKPGPVVRILAMGNQSKSSYFSRGYCQLWFENHTAPEIVAVQTYTFIWYTVWGTRPHMYYPYLLTCSVPSKRKALVPRSVSLVATSCDNATNNLRVHFETERRNDTHLRFAVCLKGLDYPYEDISARLVEWLEMMRLLGAEHIYAYELAVQENVSKVLRYYQEQRFLDVRLLTLASGEPPLLHFQHQALKKGILNKRLNEVIPYNDCFYRNMYKYDYIALLDIDEVIMPLGNLTNWSQLIQIAMRHELSDQKQKCPNGYSSICFRNVHFPHYALAWNASIAPKYMHMLQHTLRNVNHSGVGMATKCLHNTSQVVTLHNHFSLSKLTSCKPTSLEPTLAQLQHYRAAEQAVNVIELVEDRSMWRYAAALKHNTEQVLRELGFFNTV